MWPQWRSCFRQQSHPQCWVHNHALGPLWQLSVYTACTRHCPDPQRAWKMLTKLEACNGEAVQNSKFCSGAQGAALSNSRALSLPLKRARTGRGWWAGIRRRAYIPWSYKCGRKLYRLGLCSKTCILLYIFVLADYRLGCFKALCVHLGTNKYMHMFYVIPILMYNFMCALMHGFCFNGVPLLFLSFILST